VENGRGKGEIVSFFVGADDILPEFADENLPVPVQE
jgi:hypothetical protein